ncbi:unnamed protein product [Colias eurytheme]|nr:unnamed protein product [Colias eurytheme]
MFLANTTTPSSQRQHSSPSSLRQQQSARSPAAYIYGSSAAAGQCVTMSRYVTSVFVALCATIALTSGRSTKCDVQACTDSGYVCGVRRWADKFTPYASFRGVPYAKQPVGELRFKELQPLDPWEGFYDASVEGPVCPQHDVFYGGLVRNRSMSEACIYANVHVPINAITPTTEETGLPIFVFVHGGGFAFGSGDTDIHGPEYLLRRGMIVITFNYRLNVFGFLSLNSSSIPGNNGIRDVITLLRWVRTNARAFGGNPDDVTIAGQSAGAAIAHLLTLSKAAEGLFRRALIMSGTAIPSFYTTSPIYAQFVSNLFVTALGINSTNPEDIHQQLIQLPLEQIMQVNQILQDQFGIVVFLPVVETPFDGVTTVLDEDPEILLDRGVGKDIPLIVGFTDAECETFRPNFEKLDILAKIKENPLLILSPNLIYKVPIETAMEYAKKVEKRYFNGGVTMDNYIESCSDTFYIYPALELAKRRRAMKNAAPMFLYQFSYEAQYSTIKESKGLKYKGAGHVEDMTFIFRTNSMLEAKGFYPLAWQDQGMVDWMTWFVQNFNTCNDPVCDQYEVTVWPPVSHSTNLFYQDIKESKFFITELTPDQNDMVKFFESLRT